MSVARVHNIVQMRLVVPDARVVERLPDRRRAADGDERRVVAPLQIQGDTRAVEAAQEGRADAGLPRQRRERAVGRLHDGLLIIGVDAQQINVTRQPSNSSSRRTRFILAADAAPL